MRYVCLLILFAAAVLADRLVQVRVELKCESCNLSELQVDMQDPVGGTPPTQAAVNSNGEVDFRNIKEGQYVLNVSDMRGELIKREHVHVMGFSGPIQVRLAEPKQERPVSGLVSASRLMHKVPKAARREYAKAQEALERGDTAGSLAHLEKAVELDPEYMEAYNNLGSRLVMLGRPAEALVAFRRALELDPSQAMIRSNAAIALMQTHRFQEAEVESRAALRMNPADSKARYVLGLSLYCQRRYTEEAAAALRASEAEFPNAKRALEAIASQRRSIQTLSLAQPGR